jgi:hypothetical protein
MKSLITIIILLAIAGAGYWWYQSNNESETDVEIMPTTSRPDPSDATFIFEDGEVTLEDGKATTNLVPDSLFGTETIIVGDPVYGDINGDKKNDAVVLLTQSGSGSGMFVYIAAYVSGNVEYKGSNAVFVGDRISPQTVTVGNTGVITLTYLDRKLDEPMAAAPTVSTTKTYVFRNGELEER